MTVYQFESMSQTDAEAFTSTDTLVFTSPTLKPSDVVVSNLSFDALFLTAGGKTLAFAGNALSAASDADLIKFNSSFVAGSSASLVLGHQTNDGLTLAGPNSGSYAYGFAGNDSISGNDGGDNIDGGSGNDALSGGNGADNLFGGAGIDAVSGGNGNDHIYGFGLTGDPTTDLADNLSGDAGNDYIQGNAGNDIISGGAGTDRLNGGGDDDTIFGGDDNDTVNGNKGNDSIAGNNGNDSIRGGADNDVLSGNAGNDIILGDLGNDTVSGGDGIDVVTGGDGEDHFVFVNGDVNGYATTGTFAFFTDTITDFHAGGTGAHVATDDLLSIQNVATAAGDILHQQAGITLSSVSAAITYAQQLLDNHAGTTDVAAVNVGSDAYLFYSGSGSGTTIDSIIKLTGVDQANITIADFDQAFFP